MCCPVKIAGLSSWFESMLERRTGDGQETNTLMTRTQSPNEQITMMDGMWRSTGYLLLFIYHLNGAFSHAKSYPSFDVLVESTESYIW